MEDFYDTWPALDYKDFKPTQHLLHMATQVLGKLKLHTPFEPHWSNVALWLTGNGLTTGIIPYRGGAFSLEIDLMHHQIYCKSSWFGTSHFKITSTSVAELTKEIFQLLTQHQIELEINLLPQELANPIAFNQDITPREYDETQANTFWKILLSVHRVLKQYHARFDGETPPIGFMWGTFDIRDARYNGKKVKPTGINKGFIRRNAMDEAQIEVGWWPGNEMYPQPAFYAYTYPQPKDIELCVVKPKDAYWNHELGEFVFNYSDLRKLKHPDSELLSFFESAYAAGAHLGEGWDKQRLATGEPV